MCIQSKKCSSTQSVDETFLSQGPFILLNHSNGHEIESQA